jgi:hypothetical protein
MTKEEFIRYWAAAWNADHPDTATPTADGVAMIDGRRVRRWVAVACPEPCRYDDADCKGWRMEMDQE